MPPNQKLHLPPPSPRSASPPAMTCLVTSLHQQLPCGTYPLRRPLTTRRADGASEFVRFIELGGTPRRHMPFQSLVRNLLQARNCTTKSLRVRLDVGIGGWNSELELAATNATVWMSNELGNGITSRYRAAFDSIAHASSPFKASPWVS